MSLNVYYLYAIKKGTTLVGQTRNQRLNPALTLVREGPGGHVDDRFVAIGAGQPAITFSTTAIAQALTALGDIDGKSLDTDDFLAYFWKGLAGGTRSSSADNVQLTVANGIVIPTTLRAPHAPPAQIDYQVMPAYVSGNSPIAIVANASVPSVAALTEEEFCAGPVLLNGVGIDGEQDITVNFGITLEIQSHQGLVWPIHVGIRNRTPTITVRSTNTDLLATIGLEGDSITADVECYLRKTLEGGSRVSDATMQHIKITMTEGIITPGDSGATHPNPADNTITITPTDDAVNAIMAFDLASVLP